MGGPRTDTTKQFIIKPSMFQTLTRRKSLESACDLSVPPPDDSPVSISSPSSSLLRKFFNKNDPPRPPHPPGSASHKKTVSFSSLEIREYGREIGDHPLCTIGCPLSIGWEYSEALPVPVDAYEATRSPRRSRADLRTSCEERRRLFASAFSDAELRKAERKLHRVRSCQARLCEQMNADFFEGDLTATPSGL